LNPIARDVILVKDSFHGTFDSACIAVDAFIWIDVEHLVTFVEAITRTNDHAVCVFASEAGSGHDIGHLCVLLLKRLVRISVGESLFPRSSSDLRIRLAKCAEKKRKDLQVVA